MKYLLIASLGAAFTLSACGQAGTGPGEPRVGAQALHPGDATRQGLNVLGRDVPANGTNVRKPTVYGSTQSWRF